MQKVAIKFKDYEGLFYVVDDEGYHKIPLRPFLTAIGEDVEAGLEMIRSDKTRQFQIHDIELTDYNAAETEPCILPYALVELLPKLTVDYNWVAGFLDAYQNASGREYRFEITTERPTCTCCGCAPNSTNTSDEKVKEIALKRIKR